MFKFHAVTRLLGLFCLTLLLPSCGIGFQAKWARAGKAPTDGLSGRWTGIWKSDVNGHHGTLKCVVSAPDTAGKREFFYRATWLSILSASFKTEKSVMKKGDKFEFEGSKDLGVMGGEFRCIGSATPEKFSARYESFYDHGKFELTRPH